MKRRTYTQPYTQPCFEAFHDWEADEDRRDADVLRAALAAVFASRGGAVGVVGYLVPGGRHDHIWAAVR